MWWSTICIRSPTWWHCLLQGQFSYTISSLIRRLTFMDTSSISWPRALKRRTPELSCHSHLSNGPHCKDKAQTSKRSHYSTKRLSHRCTHSDSKHNSHQRIENRCVSNTKGSCWGRGWRYWGDSPLHQIVLLRHPLKHKHENLIHLIASLLR